MHVSFAYMREEKSPTISKGCANSSEMQNPRCNLGWRLPVAHINVSKRGKASKGLVDSVVTKQWFLAHHKSYIGGVEA